MAIDQCDERWGDDDGTITTDQLMTMTMMWCAASTSDWQDKDTMMQTLNDNPQWGIGDADEMRDETDDEDGTMTMYGTIYFFIFDLLSHLT